MQYEIFYLIGASHETDVEKIKEAARKIITDSGGVFEEKETLEKRRLSYKIKHETHGIYIAQRFEISDLEKIGEITRKINLQTGVLRFILSKASDLPELKSKEERIAQAEKMETSKREHREIQKKEELTVAKIVPKKKENQEDIDKKLEEILNI